MDTTSVAHGEQGFPSPQPERVIAAGCPATDAAATCEPPAPGPTSVDAVTRMISGLRQEFDRMFDEVVDRVVDRVRAAAARAAARAAAARFRDLATVSLGIAALCARRATSHGGRASQARGDDSDPAAATIMTGDAGILHWNERPSLSRGAAFCVSRREL